ncbi:unnamed protein product [Euphydryas editha]|uniref:WASH1 WAHD domain-containing protein n=1 Tax=Euphydryas editha TaxID=104508 RepID=A0AAU9V5X2_EUPED|nr:unnamed protein product [Euphydryas editha]
MEGIYKIKIISNDLSMEETVLQIADTLDNLNGIVDDIFTRISDRIKSNTDKTRKLQERIDASRTKVEKLVGMQKAIKVFSSAKYPSAIVHEHYQSIFDTNVYNYETKKVTLSGKSQRQSNAKAIQEKLHFFHVKVVEPKATKPKQDFDLKAVIDKTSTVGDLLIYNTDESPYLVMPSKTPAYVPRVNTNIEKELLEDAPPSIINKNLLKREIDEYMYAPGMGMVPELDMPLDLPHLPGIAGDVQFTILDDGSIAPSAVTSPVAPVNTILETELPELPDLKELPDVKLDVTPDMPDAPPMPPAPVAPTAPAPPSPPPPPPPPPPMDIETPKSSKR